MAMASPSKFHGAVENCFAVEDHSSLRENRKLWRIDRLGGNYYMLLLSPDKPDLGEIKEQFGFEEDMDEIKGYDALLERITEGSIWQFRLTANPTHTVKNGKQERGKVVAHASDKFQMEWLYQKAEQNGFTVLTEDSCIVESDWKIFYKRENKNRVRLKETTYQGVLRVDHEDLFRNALINGVGRGKAYGMGLLTVMRV